MTELYYGPMVAISYEEYTALEDIENPVAVGHALDFHPGIFDVGIDAPPVVTDGRPMAALGDMDRTFFLALAGNQDVLLLVVPFATSNGYLLLGRWDAERWDYVRDVACCSADAPQYARFRSIGLFIDRLSRRASRHTQYTIVHQLLELT